MCPCFSVGIPIPDPYGEQEPQRRQAASRVIGDEIMLSTTDLDQDDLAVLRELDGVAHQVDQDLPQAPEVAHQAIGNIGVDPTGQFQSFLGRLHRQRLTGAADAFPQAEIDALQFQLARLDLGKVENVVEQSQQRVGRVLDDLQEVSLLRR